MARRGGAFIAVEPKAGIGAKDRRIYFFHLREMLPEKRFSGKVLAWPPF